MEPRSKIRLIAIDLDGTVLQDDHESVSIDDRLAIMSAAQRGAQIVCATGRALLGVPDVIKVLPVSRFVITSNGAATRSWPDGAALACRPLSTDEALSSLAIGVAAGGCPVLYCNGEAFLTAADRDRQMASLNANLSAFRKFQQTLVDDLGDVVRAHEGLVEKIDIAIYDDAMRAKISKELLAAGVTPSGSGYERVEVTARGVNKGAALSCLCHHLGVDACQVMAIGDGQNDAEMLAWAGVGVAMGGTDVARFADWVAPANRDNGVARAIERFVMITNDPGLVPVQLGVT